MLAPDLLAELAARPEDNAPDVNLALAEQGPASALLALARSPHVGTQVLAVVAARALAAVGAFEPEPDPHGHEEDEEERAVAARAELGLALDRALATHAATPARARDEVLGRHREDALFVLAAASHPAATETAAELAALWPGRHALAERPWVALVPPGALGPETAAAWAHHRNVCLREAAARLATDATLLAELGRDPARGVRRALSDNPAAAALWPTLAEGDAAPEVRARAALALARGRGAPSAAPEPGERFAAALRAMQAGGELAPDVVAALTAPATLDGEGAELAGRILPAGLLVELVAQAVAGATSAAAADGLAAGIALRAPGAGDGEAGRRPSTGLTKALATSAQGGPTGRVRLAAWCGSGLGRHAAVRLDRASSDERRAYGRELAGALVEGALAADPRVLARAERACPDLVGLLCEAGVPVPPAVMELGWREPSIPDAELAALAARVSRPREAPAEPADAELDLELAARPLALLEQVALAVVRTGPVSARVALAVIALDARRVRLVMAAVPRWRERLSGAELASVLRQHAGALVASRPEARPRGSEVKAWTERLLTDAEAAVALGLGHLTAEELAARLRSGRHKLGDPAAVAAGVEARAAVEGAVRVAPVVRWASAERARRSEALALWLLLEPVEGRRTAQALAGALDALAERSAAPPPLLAEALAILERRQPGRLETLMPQSPRGKATVATALGRAYRALGDR